MTLALRTPPAALVMPVVLVLMSAPLPAHAHSGSPGDAEAAKLLDREHWTAAELQRAADADPGGELFRPSTRVDDAYELDEAFIVARGCEQTWAMATAEDPEQLSALFGDTIAVFRREETFDDGYRAQMAESIMGFTGETRETRWTFSEGDPRRRTGEMKVLADDDPTWVRYQLNDVGHPGFCAMRMQVLVTFPPWIPDFAIEWALSFGAGSLADSVREGLLEQKPWPEGREAPIKTDKGKRDRQAWRIAQRAATAPKTAARTPPPPATSSSMSDAGPVDLLDGGAP
jgi:hypothetical protein